MAHPVSQLLFDCFVKRNPVRHSGVEPTRMDQPTLYPVIDHVIAGPKLLGDLLDGQFLGLLEHSRRDLMAFADPLDHLRRIRLARSTEITFSIELIRNLRIE